MAASRRRVYSSCGAASICCALRLLDDRAVLHHHHLVGDEAHHRQVVADEDVGQAELVLQVLAAGSAPAPAPRRRAPTPPRRRSARRASASGSARSRCAGAGRRRTRAGTCRRRCSSSPTLPSSARAASLALARSAPMPWIVIGSISVWPTVKRGFSARVRVLEDDLDAALASPGARRSTASSRSWPSNSTSPAGRCGSCRRSSVRPTVVLPEPDSPTTPSVWPRRSLKCTSCTALNSRLPNRPCLQPEALAQADAPSSTTGCVPGPSACARLARRARPGDEVVDHRQARRVAVERGRQASSAWV